MVFAPTSKPAKSSPPVAGTVQTGAVPPLPPEPAAPAEPATPPAPPEPAAAPAAPATPPAPLLPPPPTPPLPALGIGLVPADAVPALVLDVPALVLDVPAPPLAVPAPLLPLPPTPPAPPPGPLSVPLSSLQAATIVTTAVGTISNRATPRQRRTTRCALRRSMITFMRQPGFFHPATNTCFQNHVRTIFGRILSHHVGLVVVTVAGARVVI
jgi:hypothetical protein